MLSDNIEYSFFISSETAVYDGENYYKVVAGTISKNNFDYYSIEEIGCIGIVHKQCLFFLSIMSSAYCFVIIYNDYTVLILRRDKIVKHRY